MNIYMYIYIMSFNNCYGKLYLNYDNASDIAGKLIVNCKNCFTNIALPTFPNQVTNG
jgi:hypothetical protein